jgi:hypothetical protein
MHCCSTFECIRRSREFLRAFQMRSRRLRCSFHGSVFLQPPLASTQTFTHSHNLPAAQSDALPLLPFHGPCAHICSACNSIPAHRILLRPQLSTLRRYRRSLICLHSQARLNVSQIPQMSSRACIARRDSLQRSRPFLARQSPELTLRFSPLLRMRLFSRPPLSWISSPSSILFLQPAVVASSCMRACHFPRIVTKDIRNRLGVLQRRVVDQMGTKKS